MIYYKIKVLIYILLPFAVAFKIQFAILISENAVFKRIFRVKFGRENFRRDN